MMTPREVVCRTIDFRSPDRLARSLPEPWGSDFAHVGMSPSPDARPGSGVDEWGCVWENIGICRLGEVKHPALTDWADWDRLAIPDIRDERRWQNLAHAREQAGERFLLANGISLYERVHFLRGLEETWIDIYENRQRLGELIDLLAEMNIHAIERYAAAGADGIIWCDDWGLQDRLMIDPQAWREIWKPCYARVYAAARAAGLRTFLHSCGHIVSILDDLIEVGLNVIQMDQQQNMGLATLAGYAGQLAFWCPVDIQNVMTRGSLDEIRAYARSMVAALSTPAGGFIAKYYADPVGAGHAPEAITAMCEEFLAVSAERGA